MKKSKTDEMLHPELPAENSKEEMAETENIKPEQADLYSIKEFIEMKKLQNKILKKMLEKMNEPENKDQ